MHSMIGLLRRSSVSEGDLMWAIARYFYDVKMTDFNGKTVCLFGIFDGETYKQTDMDFLDAEKDTSKDDGSTASTAVLVDNHLYVANVGDSRAVVSKAGKATPIFDDHKPNRSAERKRIKKAGGVVMWAGTWRAGGVLAMSRAFGNHMLKQFVVAEPEIQFKTREQQLLVTWASSRLHDDASLKDMVDPILGDQSLSLSRDSVLVCKRVLH